MAIVANGQDLPKNFKQTVQKEYDGIKKDGKHPEFKLTFEQYFKLMKEEYLADQKFYKSLNNRSANDLCSNGTFEEGVTESDWEFFWGGGSPTYVSGNTMLNTGTFGPNNSTPAHGTQVHHQVQSAGNDEIVGSLLNKVYSYPVGNTKSLRLGNALRDYGKERIVKNNVLITSTNSSFSFSYALVMNDPQDHGLSIKPYFKVEIIDVDGTDYSNLIDLGGGSNVLVSNHPSLIHSGIQEYNDTVVYKPWNCFTFDLSSIIGKTVRITFEVRDCNWGGHFAYAYLDNICLPCDWPNPEGTINLNQSQSDTCEIPGQICLDYTLPNGNNPALTVDLELIQNGVVVNTLSSPSLTSGNLYCFQLNTANTNSLNTSLNGFDYKIIGHPMLGTFPLTNIIIGSSSSGVKPSQNNDYMFICPDSSDLCCNIPNFTASLTESNGIFSLNLNGGSVPIQEVEVSMADYHATYSEPGCQPVNMDASGGHIGYMNTTTNNLASLNLVTNQNNSHVLSWVPGTPSLLNNTVNFSVLPPSVINVSCCSVNFWFCIKVRVKDINCNVCEQILCYPSSTTCNCGGWDNNPIHVIGIINRDSLIINPPPNDNNSRTRPVIGTPVNCGGTITLTKGEYVFSVPNFSCIPNTCTATYQWMVQGPVTGSGTGKPFTFNFSQIGTYTVTITPSCGTQQCDPCIVTVVINDSECHCGKWSGNYMYLGINPQTPLSSKPRPVACNGSITYDGPQSLHISIGDYYCTPSTCHTIYRWNVSGPVIGNGTGKPFDFNFSQPGTYTVTITPYCGSHRCEPCIITVIIKPVDCNCKGSGWLTGKPMLILYGSGQVAGNAINGGNISLPAPGTYQFMSPLHICNPAPPNCQATYKWEVQGPATGNGPGSTFSFNFTQPGTYTVIITAICGTQDCPPFKFNVTIASSCSCGSWEPGIIKWTKPDGTEGVIVLNNYQGEVIELTPFQPGNVYLIAKHNCSYSNAVCKVTWLCTITKGDGTPHLTLPSVELPNNYPYNTSIMTISGLTWVHEFTVKCGNNVCQKYIIKFKAK